LNAKKLVDGYVNKSKTSLFFNKITCYLADVEGYLDVEGFTK